MNDERPSSNTRRYGDGGGGNDFACSLFSMSRVSFHRRLFAQYMLGVVVCI